MVKEELKPENKNLSLIREVKNGSARALDELVGANMGLVKNIARRFIGRGTDYEDIVQIGKQPLFYWINRYCKEQ